MISTVLITIKLSLLALASAIQPATEEVVSRMEAGYRPLNRCVLRQERWKKTENDEHGTEAAWAKHVLELRYDGLDYDTTGEERFDLLQSEWRDLPAKDAEPQDDQGAHSRVAWDGRMYYTSMRYSDASFQELLQSDITASRRIKDRHFIPTIGHDGAPLGGYMFGDSKSVAEILRLQSSVKLRDRKEPVNGAECWVIDATGKHGQYTLWIDSEHGFLVVKAEVQKRFGDLFYASPLVSRRQAGRGRPSAVSWTMDGVQVERIGNVWIPTACECRIAIEYGDAEPITETALSIQRTRIILDPDFEAMGAFTPNVPNGTRVGFQETPGLRYLWQDGELAPDYDRSLVAGIDRCFAEGLQVESGPMLKSENFPHCGLYSLYGAAKHQQVDIDFAQLLKPAYISKSCGSSLGELAKAATDMGLHALPVTGMSTFALEQCPCPAILHVKPSPTSVYKHWILYVGTDQGQAVVMDPPHSIRHCALGELATLWKGDALLVSATPVNSKAILGPGRRCLILVLGGIVMAVLIIRKFHKRMPAMASTRALLGRRLGLSALQAATLLAITATGGLLCHYLNREGLLANTSGVRLVQEASAGTFIPHVDAAKVDRLLARDAVFVDARFAADFEQGHLEGAINVPVDANDVDLQNSLTSVSKNANIVVYCQSAGCQFAEKVALRLMKDGFSDLAVYRGGWMDWRTKHADEQTPDEKGGHHDI
jgi:rhodanese-related sulfurtransferase